jgi:hypothetical protein
MGHDLTTYDVSDMIDEHIHLKEDECPKVKVSEFVFLWFTQAPCKGNGNYVCWLVRPPTSSQGKQQGDM